MKPSIITRIFLVAALSSLLLGLLFFLLAGRPPYFTFLDPQQGVLYLDPQDPKKQTLANGKGPQQTTYLKDPSENHLDFANGEIYYKVKKSIITTKISGRFSKRGISYPFSISGSQPASALLETAKGGIRKIDGIISFQKRNLEHIFFQVPGMDEIRIKRDIEYKKSTYGNGRLSLDIYYAKRSPADPQRTAIIIPGTNNHHLAKVKDSGRYVSWARVLAARGFDTVTFDWTTDFIPEAAYMASSPKNVQDIRDLLQFIKTNSDALDIRTESASVLVFATNSFEGYALSVGDGLNVCLEQDPGFVTGIAAFCGKLPDQLLAKSPLETPPLLFVDGKRNHLTYGADDMFLSRGFGSTSINTDLLNKLTDGGYHLEELYHSKGGMLFDITHDDKETAEIVDRVVRFLTQHSTSI